jgi:hypothetical protein
MDSHSQRRGASTSAADVARARASDGPRNKPQAPAPQAKQAHWTRSTVRPAAEALLAREAARGTARIGRWRRHLWQGGARQAPLHEIAMHVRCANAPAHECTKSVRRALKYLWASSRRHVRAFPTTGSVHERSGRCTSEGLRRAVQQALSATGQASALDMKHREACAAEALLALCQGARSPAHCARCDRQEASDRRAHGY